MSFDALAPHYSWMEKVLAGEKLQRCRVRWLPEMLHCRKVLLIGEGHGRFLAECLRYLPLAHIASVDSSLGMIEQARARCSSWPGFAERVSFIHADLFHWIPHIHGCDLIVSNFCFDCFTQKELSSIIPRIATASAPGANWLVAEFHTPAKGWSRWRSRIILAAAYSFFRVATNLSARSLPSYEPLLNHSGFTLVQRGLSEWGLLTADRFVRSSNLQGHAAALMI